MIGIKVVAFHLIFIKILYLWLKLFAYEFWFLNYFSTKYVLENVVSGRCFSLLYSAD